MEDAKHGRTKQRLGWAFIGAVVLSAAGVQGYIEGGAIGIAGGSIGAGAMALLLWGLAWLITRKKSESAKATGTLAVGVLLLLSSGLGQWLMLQDHQQAEWGRGMMLKIGQAYDEHLSASNAVNAQLQTIKWGAVLSAESMATPVGRARGLAEMDRHAELLAKRREVVEAGFAKMVQIAETETKGNGELTRSVLQGREEGRRLLAPLDAAQVKMEGLARGLIGWVDSLPPGDVRAQGNKLLFKTKAQSAEFQEWADVIQTADAEYVAATNAATAAQATSEEKLKALRQQY